MSPETALNLKMVQYWGTKNIDNFRLALKAKEENKPFAVGVYERISAVAYTNALCYWAQSVTGD